MTLPESKEEASWGFHTNSREIYHLQTLPAWLNKKQQKSWTEKGLAIWDKTTGSVTHLTGEQVLQIYQHWQSNTEWQQAGFLIGEPAYMIPLNKDKPGEGQWKLTNTTQLSGDQAQKVFEFIQKTLISFEKMAQEDREERVKALGIVYNIILNWPD